MNARTCLVFWAVGTLIVGVVWFFATDWASRYDDPVARCANSGRLVEIVTQSERGLGFREARRERIPPGVRCVGERDEFFLAADAVAWMSLAGYSAAIALGATLMIAMLSIVGRRLRGRTRPS